MKKLKIDEVTITNVTQSSSSLFNKNGHSITFNMDGFRYNLYMSEQEDGIVYPKYIVHFNKKVNAHTVKEKGSNALD